MCKCARACVCEKGWVCAAHRNVFRVKRYLGKRSVTKVYTLAEEKDEGPCVYACVCVCGWKVKHHLDRYI